MPSVRAECHVTSCAMHAMMISDFMLCIAQEITYLYDLLHVACKTFAYE